jgi:DNA polymerase III epsilon subunit-like protein
VQIPALTLFIKIKGTNMKFLWVDTETTGLDPVKNEIIQIAALLECTEKQIAQEFISYIKPTNFNCIDKEATKTHGISIKKMKTFPLSSVVYSNFKEILYKWVDPMNKETRITLGGQNVTFDSMFIDEFFKRNEDTYWRAFITPGVFDLKNLTLQYELFHNKKIFDSYKLSRVCEILGVKLKKAHDAFSDISATRKCCLKIWNEITKDN